MFNNRLSAVRCTVCALQAVIIFGSDVVGQQRCLSDSWLLEPTFNGPTFGAWLQHQLDTQRYNKSIIPLTKPRCGSRIDTKNLSFHLCWLGNYDAYASDVVWSLKENLSLQSLELFLSTLNLLNVRPATVIGCYSTKRINIAEYPAWLKNCKI